jgi:hypothetical protein
MGPDWFWFCFLLLILVLRAAPSSLSDLLYLPLHNNSSFVDKPNDVRIIELCIIDLSTFVDEYSARMPRRGIRNT